jgi:hypothetical protein
MHNTLHLSKHSGVGINTATNQQRAQEKCKLSQHKHPLRWKAHPRKYQAARRAMAATDDMKPFLEDC